MKWYNKSKTLMIDLSKVSFFEYIPREYTKLENILKLSVDGFAMKLEGESADEVYKVLTSTNKEIINS